MQPWIVCWAAKTCLHDLACKLVCLHSTSNPNNLLRWIAVANNCCKHGPHQSLKAPCWDAVDGICHPAHMLLRCSVDCSMCVTDSVRCLALVSALFNESTQPFRNLTSFWDLQVNVTRTMKQSKFADIWFYDRNISKQKPFDYKIPCFVFASAFKQC